MIKRPTLELKAADNKVSLTAKAKAKAPLEAFKPRDSFSELFGELQSLNDQAVRDGTGQQQMQPATYELRVRISGEGVRGQQQETWLCPCPDLLGTRHGRALGCDKRAQRARGHCTCRGGCVVLIQDPIFVVVAWWVAFPWRNVLAKLRLRALAKHADAALKAVEVAILRAICESGCQDGFTTPVVAICIQDVVIAMVMADGVRVGRPEGKGFQNPIQYLVQHSAVRCVPFIALGFGRMSVLWRNGQ